MRNSIAWPSMSTSSWREVEFLAGGDAQLPLHHVEARHLLGDAVLDLNAGVNSGDRSSPPHRAVPLARGRCPLRRGLDSPGVVVVRFADAASGGVADRSRSASDSAGDGASSMTFWWRRWSEQSRSPRWRTLPCSSARICTSMWRGLSRYVRVDGVVREVRLSLPFCAIELFFGSRGRGELFHGRHHRLRP